MFETIKEYALLLFTPDQWFAFSMMLIATIGLTETIKRVFFAGMPKLKRSRFIWGAAFLVGVLIAVVAKVINPAYNLWFLLVMASILGPCANVIHFAVLWLIAWKFPKLAEIIKGGK